MQIITKYIQMDKKVSRNVWAVAEVEVLHKVVGERMGMGWSLWDAAKEASLQLHRTAESCHEKWKYDQRAKERRIQKEKNKNWKPLFPVNPITVENVAEEANPPAILEDVKELKIEFKDIKIDLPSKMLIIIL
jgi:hypothetical protein